MNLKKFLYDQVRKVKNVNKMKSEISEDNQKPNQEKSIIWPIFMYSLLVFVGLISIVLIINLVWIPSLNPIYFESTPTPQNSIGGSETFHFKILLLSGLWTIN